MPNSLTIVIPNRNRDLKTVRHSLDSIVPQLTVVTRLVIVDYGSELSYQAALEQLIHTYKQVELILCPTQGQLWNKSRCINIVLKRTTATHLMVSDMDMIWHPQFVKNQLSRLSLDQTVYFTVGIMTQEESALEKSFDDYQVKFQTNHEATGISIFPVLQLRYINGFDEFYHGWGSEDTDVHVRLRNAGYEVCFRESVIYFKHQWHAKFYRNKDSKDPFHGVLEKINQQYLALTDKLGQYQVNQYNDFNWGVLPRKEDYEILEHPTVFLNVNHISTEITALLFKLSSIRNFCIAVKVDNHRQKKSFKIMIKKLLGKKIKPFLNADSSNELILEFLISTFRNCPYKYEYNRQAGEIKFVISIMD